MMQKVTHGCLLHADSISFSYSSGFINVSVEMAFPTCFLSTSYVILLLSVHSSLSFLHSRIVTGDVSQMCQRPGAMTSL